jgi:hypothetical protein
MDVEIRIKHGDGGCVLEFACPSGIPPAEINDAGISFRHYDRREIEAIYRGALIQTEGQDLYVRVIEASPGAFIETGKCAEAPHASLETALTCLQAQLTRWLRRFKHETTFTLDETDTQAPARLTDWEVARAAKDGRLVINPDGSLEVDEDLDAGN